MVDKTFVKLSNFRDLGGMKNQEGKSIKPYKLLRSGQLYDLPSQEIQTLETVYQLKTIVDLRRPIEAEKSPNSEIQGATNHLLDVSGGAEYSTTQEAFLEYLSNVSADESLMRSYESFILSDNAISQYRQFFDILLNQEDGSLLWHCFAGKDRTGIAALYLLTALNVDDDTIMEDYLLTNELREHDNQIRINELREQGVSEPLVQNMYEMLRVKESYLKHAIKLIDDNFGNRTNFLYNKLDLDDSKIAKLYHMYLD